MKRLKVRLVTLAPYIIVCLLLLVQLIGGGNSAPAVYADTVGGGYSDVLDDLQSDENFNVNDYPIIITDYSIQVIQIAESQDNELFVYTYQPCQPVYPLTATEINMSLSADVGTIVVDGEYVAGSTSSKLYTLTYLSSDGVFVKYKVNDFTVSGDMVRYYTISSIYRNYIEEIDGKSENDNTIISKSFAVGKQFAAMTTADGVVYSCTDIDYVVIENPYVDFLAYGTYGNIFDLIFGVTDYTDIHYIAFSTDKQIDTLKEADVTYTTQDYTYYSAGNNKGYTYGDKSEAQYITLTGDENFGVDGYPKYTWNSIYTTEEFLALDTIDLNDTAKEQLEKTEFVLVFLATDCRVEDLWSFNWGHYQKVEGVKVSDVSILRLMFETDGVTYNLGVVMDKQEGDNIAGNKTEHGSDIPWWAYVLVVLFEIIVLLLLRLILCTACGLPKWLIFIFLAVVVVLDIFFISTFAGWCYALIAGG